MAPASNLRTTLYGILRQATRLGFRPRLVYDVGAANGTAELVSLFPAARHVLIEPLEEFGDELAKLRSSVAEVEIVRSAAGRREEERWIHVHSDLLGSSLYAEKEEGDVNGVARLIQVTTLDHIHRKQPVQGPCLVKIDVQGAELEVLEGAIQVLRDTEFAVIECSLFRFYEAASSMNDVIDLMRLQGFAIYDIGGLHYRPLDGALAQVDMAFVKECGIFRAHHHYATAEQRAMLNQMAVHKRRQDDATPSHRGSSARLAESR